MPQFNLIFVFFLGLFSFVFCSHQATVSRALTNDGFHREIVTNIDIYSTGVDYPCSILLVEYLPRTVFVELNEIQRQLNNPLIKIDTNVSVDIEAIASSVKAAPFKVYTFLPTQTHPKYSTSVTLPVHFRYQSAAYGGNYGQVVIGQPSLFSKCVNSDNDPSGPKFDMPCSFEDRSSCKWIKLGATFSERTLVAKIPIGDLNWSLYVQILTYAILSTATFIVAKAIYRKRL